MGHRKRPQANQATNFDGDVSNQLGTVSHDGSVKYVGELGENVAPPTYQEAGGAPVESHSPLGYTVGPITMLFLNISMMIGTGIYSTPSAILAGTGSVGLSMIYWILGAVISLCSAAVYLEYAACFPSRSGTEIVNLEQAYPWPRYLFPTAFAMQNIILSFRSSNAIVLADYLFATNGSKGTDWQIKGVAIAGYTIAFVVVLLHTRSSYYLSNAIGSLKLITLIFIAVTGFVVLGGHTKVQNPIANFDNAFQGSATPYGLTNALYRIIFSYGGYNNAFNVVNEIRNPVKQIKRNGTIAILVVMTLYVFTNVALIAAVGKEKLESPGTIAASLFFTAVFGSGNAAKGLNFLTALSSFGNMVAVMIGAARMLRECGRQGVLPVTRFWVSTWPFGTPAGPYMLDWALTVDIILTIPTGDAFNFVSDLAVLPNSVFNLAMAVGLYIVRWRRKKANLPRPSFKAWHPVVIFNILVQLYLVVMPWYPPAGGKGDVAFWYGTHVVTGLGIVLLCGAYYLLGVQLLPRWQGYRLRQKVLQLSDGAQTHHLIKVPVYQVKEWDRTHDLTGRTIEDQSSQQSTENVTTSIAGEKPA
ncbi:putative high affinity methionine permease protein [Seiridium unicorne]|uniref:High affinity methionine permease protein n=1 Tax=Seiridium unicorne TaxID=138068 RepID=A0ABR2UKJ1_9PEZI